MKYLLSTLFAWSLLACTTHQPGTTSNTSWSALKPGWNEIPGGDATICSNGTPYAFFFYPGNRDKLVVFFQGGGACWNPINCDLTARPTYDPTIDALDNPGSNQANLGGYAWGGIFDLHNPENPLKDYSILLVPYCTGDTHLGAKEVTYTTADTSFVIHHQGYRNAMASLNWVFQRMQNPSQIFVTGASAGSLAAPVYASIVADHYKNASIVHLGDCSGAYRPEGTKRLTANWGSSAILQAAGFDTTTIQSTQDMLIAAARKHPNLMFAQYNAAFDATQQFFLSLTGENQDSILAFIKTHDAQIARSVPNYTSYVDTGLHHVILTRPQFYTTNGAGRPFKDWLTDLLEQRKPASIACDVCR